MRWGSWAWMLGLGLIACGGNPEVAIPGPQLASEQGGAGGDQAEGGEGPGVMVGVGGAGEGEAVCGDFEVGGDEECDDGDDQAGDGCSDECQVEPGYSCEPLGGECYECGNGVVEGSEECDD